MRISTDRNFARRVLVCTIEVGDDDFESCPAHIARQFGQAESVAEALEALALLAMWCEVEDEAQAVRDAFHAAVQSSFKRALDIAAQTVMRRAMSLPVFTPEAVVPVETKFIPAQKEPLLLPPPKP